MQKEEEGVLTEQQKERQTSEVNIAIDEGIASSKLLEYELTVFTDLQAEDGLVITAKYAIHKHLFSYYDSFTIINLQMYNIKKREDLFAESQRLKHSTCSAQQPVWKLES